MATGRIGRPGPTGPLANAPMVLIFFLAAGLVVGSQIERSAAFTDYFKISVLFSTFCAIPFILQSWRSTWVLTLVYLFFSGFINHMTNFDPFSHVLKFVFMVGVTVHFLVEKLFIHPGPIWPREPEARRVALLIVALTFVGACQLLNPHWSSMKVGLVAGLVSLTSHVLPMYIFFISYHLLDSRRDLDRYLHLIVALVNLMALFALLQYYVIGMERMAELSPSFASTLVREHIWLSDFKPVYKPISFASDAGIASNFFAIGTVFCALLLGREQKRWWVFYYLLASATLMSLSLFLTYVRVALVTVVLGVSVAAFFTRQARVLLVLLVSLAALAFLSFTQENFLLYRFLELTQPVGAFQRNRSAQLAQIWVHLTLFPLGAGVGRAGPRAYWGAPDEDRFLGQTGENYYAGVAFEMGVVGLGLILWLLYTIVSRGYRIVQRTRDPTLRVYGYGALGMIGALIISGFSGPVFYVTPANIIFWFLVGIMMSYRRLDAGEAATPEPAPAPAPPGARRVLLPPLRPSLE